MVYSQQSQDLQARHPLRSRNTALETGGDIHISRTQHPPLPCPDAPSMSVPLKGRSLHVQPEEESVN